MDYLCGILLISRIHATIAGVLLASTIPHRIKDKDFSLLLKIEHAISPYVAFAIMPIFAFANAGVSLQGLTLGSLMAPVPLGIVCGLFLVNKLVCYYFHTCQLSSNLQKLQIILIG